MVEWIKKYSIIIISILCVLLFLQTCRSCVNNSTYEYENIENVYKIDSLQKQYNISKDSIMVLNDSIQKCNMRIDHLNKKIDILLDERKFLRNQNKSLIDIEKNQNNIK